MLATIAVAGGALALACAVRAQDAPQPVRVPTLQRLDRAYLQRLHEQTAALAAERKPVALATGYRDLRCVLHAHSHLSHDSRGTIGEIAAAAKAAGVDAVFLTNHPQKQLDVVAAGQKEPVDGVLFAAGAETNGFLAFPGDGKLPPLDVGEQAFVSSIRASGGQVFIAHPEEHKDWNLTGLTGMEVYNTHADLNDERELLAALQPKDTAGYGRLLKLLDAVHAYPQEGFAALFDAPTANLAHYDALFARRPLAAIAGNDSHQNTGFVLRGAEDGKIAVEDALGQRVALLDPAKTPLLALLFPDPQPGKELMRRILDPYAVSFHYVSTHVLARDRTVPAIREALAAARTYVAFDWIADPTGTAFVAQSAGRTDTLGATVPLRPDLRLRAEVPLACTLRLLCDGREVARATGRALDYHPTRPGVYRLEADVPLGDEQRPWIYTGGIRVREEG